VPDTAPSPLAGKRVVITRALAQCGDLSTQLSALGALPIVFPLVSIEPPENFAALDAGLARLGEFDWLIFTSVNAVDAVIDRLASLKLSLHQVGTPRQVAAVGPTTASAAERAGFTVAYSAKSHSGLALANELGEAVRATRIFLPRSDRANPDLPAVLRHHGAHVTEAVAYRTLPPADLDPNLRAEISANKTDAILFFSPTAVENFADVFGAEELLLLQNAQAIVAIGPVTAASLKKFGATGFATSDDTTSVAVLRALELCFIRFQNHSSMGANRG
jgi:uroporphyrinogen III methyltransferase / synthase